MRAVRFVLAKGGGRRGRRRLRLSWRGRGLFRDALVWGGGFAEGEGIGVYDVFGGRMVFDGDIFWWDCVEGSCDLVSPASIFYFQKKYEDSNDSARCIYCFEFIIMSRNTLAFFELPLSIHLNTSYILLLPSQHEVRIRWHLGYTARYHPVKSYESHFDHLFCETKSGTVKFSSIMRAFQDSI